MGRQCKQYFTNNSKQYCQCPVVHCVIQLITLLHLHLTPSMNDYSDLTNIRLRKCRKNSIIKTTTHNNIFCIGTSYTKI